MKKTWMLAFVVLGCGGEPTPAAAPPAPAVSVSVPVAVVSVAPAPTEAAKPEVLPPKTVPLVAAPACVVEGAGSFQWPLELRVHDEPFARIGRAEWAEVQLASGRATAVGRTDEMDFAAETDPKPLVVQKTRTLIDGWLASPGSGPDCVHVTTKPSRPRPTRQARCRSPRRSRRTARSAR
jgi:hypothetical protein